MPPHPVAVIDSRAAADVALINFIMTLCLVISFLCLKHRISAKLVNFFQNVILLD